jgi:hypothetical protein
LLYRSVCNDEERFTTLDHWNLLLAFENTLTKEKLLDFLRSSRHLAAAAI